MLSDEVFPEPVTIRRRGASVVEDPGDPGNDDEREEDAQPPEDIEDHPRHPPLRDRHCSEAASLGPPERREGNQTVTGALDA